MSAETGAFNRGFKGESPVKLQCILMEAIADVLPHCSFDLLYYHIFVLWGDVGFEVFSIVDNQKSSGKAEQKSFKQAGMINFF